MKVALIGCVSSSKMALTTLLQIPEVKVSAVVTKAASKINNDFCDLRPTCEEYGIPIHYENSKKREESTEFLREKQVDVIYCVGWSYLLDDEVISLAPLGVIGFHPAALPQNRGRHPIIWALALGLKKTASTFFKITEGVDSGPIISQEPIDITEKDDAQSLYNKILDVACKQIKTFTKSLVSGDYQFREQEESKATYWRKRSRADGLIDFRMSATSIYNLVRALAPPYPCAEFLYNEKAYRVFSARISEINYPSNIEPGKVLSIDGGEMVVKVADHEAIVLTNFDDVAAKPGEYLI